MIRPRLRAGAWCVAVAGAPGAGLCAAQAFRVGGFARNPQVKGTTKRVHDSTRDAGARRAAPRCRRGGSAVTSSCDGVHPRTGCTATERAVVPAGAAGIEHDG